MKIRLLLILPLIALMLDLSAQQLPGLTQYMHRLNEINPAATGVNDLTQVSIAHRSQWLNIKGGPSTQYVTFNTPLRSYKFGAGINIYNDWAGIVGRTGVQLNYAFHIKLSSREDKLSFGLMGGLSQYQLQGDKMTIKDQYDPAVFMGANASTLSPDGGFGILVKGKSYHVGVSMGNLVPLQLNFSTLDGAGQTIQGAINLKWHYFATATYIFRIDESINLEPSIMIKVVDPAPVQGDFNLNLRFDKMFLLGFGYRTNGEVMAIIGFSIKNRMHIIFSYDLYGSKINKTGNNSMEIFLRYDFKKMFKAKTKSAPLAE